MKTLIDGHLTGYDSSDTLSSMKIAISLPDPLFEKTDRYAHELGVARSQLIAEALAEYLDRHGPDAVTAKLDAVHATEDADLDPALLRAQAATLDDEAW